MQFQIGRRTDFNNAKLNSMHFLRAEVFKQRKGWDVTQCHQPKLQPCPR